MSENRSAPHELVIWNNLRSRGFGRSALQDVALNYVADLFEHLIQELCTGAKSINQLTELSQFSAYQPALILDAVRLSQLGGQVSPFSHATDAPAEKTSRPTVIPSGDSIIYKS